MKTQLEYNRNGSLVFYPSEGMPTSATLELFTGQSAALGAWVNPTAITLGTYAENLTAPITNPEATSIIPVSITGLPARGRRMILINHLGQVEQITISGSQTGEVHTSEPLTYAQTTASVLYDAALVASLTAADHTGTRYRNVRAVWTYTVLGVVYRRTQLFDIVYQPWAVPVSAADFGNYHQAFDEYSGDTTALEGMVDAARTTVELSLLAAGHQPDLIRDPDVLKPCVIYKVLQMFEEQQSAVNVDQVSMWRRNYNESFSRVVASKHLWVDFNDNLEVDSGTSESVLIGTALHGRPGSFMGTLYGTDASETDGPKVNYAKVG